MLIAVSLLLLASNFSEWKLFPYSTPFFLSLWKSLWLWTRIAQILLYDHRERDLLNMETKLKKCYNKIQTGWSLLPVQTALWYPYITGSQNNTLAVSILCGIAWFTLILCLWKKKKAWRFWTGNMLDSVDLINWAVNCTDYELSIHSYSTHLVICNFKQPHLFFTSEMCFWALFLLVHY